MFRKITITEDSYEKVLKKIQKVTNKYKVRNSRSCYKDGERTYHSPFIRVSSTIVVEPSTGDFKRKRCICLSKLGYARTMEHHSHTNPESIPSWCIDRQKVYIHINLGRCCAQILTEGDKVRFLPFGGFIIYTDDSYTCSTDENGEKHITTFVDTYLPGLFRGKIKSLYDENKEMDRLEEQTIEEWAEIDEMDELEEIETMEDYDDLFRPEYDETEVENDG